MIRTLVLVSVVMAAFSGAALADQIAAPAESVRSVGSNSSDTAAIRAQIRALDHEIYRTYRAGRRYSATPTFGAGSSSIHSNWVSSAYGEGPMYLQSSYANADPLRPHGLHSYSGRNSFGAFSRADPALTRSPSARIAKINALKDRRSALKVLLASKSAS